MFVRMNPSQTTATHTRVGGTYLVLFRHPRETITLGATLRGVRLKMQEGVFHGTTRVGEHEVEIRHPHENALVLNESPLGADDRWFRTFLTPLPERLITRLHTPDRHDSAVVPLNDWVTANFVSLSRNPNKKPISIRSPFVPTVHAQVACLAFFYLLWPVLDCDIGSLFLV